MRSELSLVVRVRRFSKVSPGCAGSELVLVIRHSQGGLLLTGGRLDMMSRSRLLSTPLLARAARLLPASVRALASRSAMPPCDRASVQRAIWKIYHANVRVWGYTDRHSVASGEKFSVMLSTGPALKAVTGKIEVFRIGYYGASDRKCVLSAGPEQVVQRDVQLTAASLGAGWPSVWDIATDGWETGYYTVDFIDDADAHRDRDVAFIVVTNPDKSGDVLVELSTNTYQAYNAWGGASLYETAFTFERAQMVSFNRPTMPHFLIYEYYFVLWLERLAAEENFKVDYATNYDLHRDSDFAEKYRLLVSGSHNEYWSKEEFDAVYRRIFELGKNMLFLGANTAYWQVRYGDLDNPTGGVGQGRQLICYKDDEDPIRQRVADEREAKLLVTAMFRQEARRPETMLMGVAYQSHFNSRSDAKYPYFVARTDLPFFTGTGYREGEAIGDIVGYEWDNTDPEGDGKRLWDAERAQIPLLDRSLIKVVFRGAPVDHEGKHGTAEAIYFVSPARAKVFSTGSIRWAWGLGKPQFAEDKFKKFNCNLIMHLLDRAGS
jgi:hypothetical protein